MKLHQLRDVVAIAERGGLRAASRHLQLAQPALTRSLGELERELGTALFERHARGMVLTSAGTVFVQRATAILHEVRRAGEEIDQLQGGVCGSVAMALSIAPHIALLPRALPPFRARYPAVQLRVIEGIYPTVEGGLRDGSIDFYIGPEPADPGRNLPGRHAAARRSRRTAAAARGQALRTTCEQARRCPASRETAGRNQGVAGASPKISSRSGCASPPASGHHAGTRQ